MFPLLRGRGFLFVIFVVFRSINRGARCIGRVRKMKLLFPLVLSDERWKDFSTLLALRTNKGNGDGVMVAMYIHAKPRGEK